MTIAITGATGNIGGSVARALAADGTPFRMVVRDASRAPELTGADVAVATYADADAARAAFAGVEVLFLVSGAEARDRLDQHRTVIRAAADAGVRHVVYTSFQGAAADATFTLGRDHFWTEQAIRDTSMAHTFLRDSFYLDFVEDLVGEDGVIRGPADDGAMAAVARADVARVATAVLREPARHLDRTYDLTGPVAITLGQAAAVVSDVRGRPVSYHRESLEEAYASRQRWQPEPWQADAWVSTYTAIADGSLAKVSGDVERVTGRPPMTLRQVLEARGA
ncbi:SDR family NAD(P)-dependent oxidoreductase [Curtobacterium sp. MCPF17_047]|uniref:NmrA family NAD(P)-binding protein n=1 Tax=unclassified Curtobacterium TaxID=257496 RepID=UPI000DA90050|nr:MULTISPECIES: NmrA family NAD(P)-binding protein [unclassified Curtobacterium]PZE62955.1 SDR family NAD(P)-dependent oxidoreductase [Curtobacterium sp. MCPF17_001]PZF68885.1 SDR family NAD(P)-dependent oxidoreductase [Curtobacterium sp. MCPF17_047]WIB13923.1 NAD(P)H-binding protein [Curtobacterium sp. MCPF17_052]